MGEILLYLFLGLVTIGVGARLHSLVRPTPFPPWMTPILEGPLRRRVASPDKTLSWSGLTQGQRVLEVGPGGGYLTELALERLGPTGRLICLDLQIEMLRKVRTRLGERSPALVCASGSELPFREGALDLVFLVSVLGEIPDRPAAMSEYARILRKDGVLAVTEALPDPDYVRAPVLRRLAQEAGLEFRERFGSWVHRTHRFVRP